MAVGRVIRVGIVDAQPLYRAGVSSVLREFGSIEILAQGGNATDALHIAKRIPVDILLLDTDIAGGWKQALASIVGTTPSVRVVILSASETEADVIAALQLGARGYILKEVSGSSLVSALRMVEAGNLYVTPTLAAQLIMRQAPQQTLVVAPASTTGLTARETEIITQVSVGATNKEVARQLRISEKTVKHYMTTIMHKLQVRNRVEAVLAVKANSKSAA